MISELKVDMPICNWVLHTTFLQMSINQVFFSQAFGCQIGQKHSPTKVCVEEFVFAQNGHDLNFLPPTYSQNEATFPSIRWPRCLPKPDLAILSRWICIQKRVRDFSIVPLIIWGHPPSSSSTSKKAWVDNLVSNDNLNSWYELLK